MTESPDRSGTTLGPYELIRLIGRGGMGEVYEATDTRLGRAIALKILRPEVVQDAERKARFEREAKALAALNHPGIVTIHSFETIDDVTFFTMEKITGQPLTDIIRDEGRMPVERVLELGIPIADALATAHKQGIAHRDVKPDNIIVGPKGEVTVLDFGLAKLATSTFDTMDDSGSATASIHATVEGRIFGTVHYMSPEQAQGGETNATTDVFSLGVVLYEMATGTSPFSGDTALSKLSSILKDDPDRMREYNDEVPVELERIIRRCLEKEPDRRWQTAIDVRNELDILRDEIARGSTSDSESNPETAATTTGSANGGSSGMNRITVALSIVAVGLIAFWLGGRGDQLPPPADADNNESMQAHTSIAAPEGYEVMKASISPDGQLVCLRTRKKVSAAEAAAEESLLDRVYLHLRNLDSFETRLIPGSASNVFHRFSPDGKALFFVQYNEDPSLPVKLMRLDLSADVPPVLVSTLPRGLIGYNEEAFGVRGFTWSGDDTLVFMTEKPYEVVRLNATNGIEIARLPITFDTPLQPNEVLCELAPNRIMFAVNYYNERGFNQDLYWIDPTTAENGRVLANAPYGKLVGSDQLAFTRGATLYTTEFDPTTMTASNQPTPVLSDVRTINSWSGGIFDIADNGTLIYLPGGVQGGERLIWNYDREGNASRMPFKPLALEEGISVSDDGEKFLTVNTNNANLNWDMLKGTYDPARIRTFAAFPDRDAFRPAVSRDGRLAVVKVHTTVPSRLSELQLYDMDTGRSLGTITTTELEDLYPLDLSPDNQEVLYNLMNRQTNNGRMHVLSAKDGADTNGTPKPLVQTEANYNRAEWSPDGRMLAFISTESGQSEAFISTYDENGLGRIQPVSNGLAQSLGWMQPDGEPLQLLYYSDRTEFSRTVEPDESGITLGPITPTGRTLHQDDLEFDVDMSGRIHVIRKGDNERPANRAQIIMHRFAPREGTDRQ